MTPLAPSAADAPAPDAGSTAPDLVAEGLAHVGLLGAEGAESAEEMTEAPAGGEGAEGVEQADAGASDAEGGGGGDDPAGPPEAALQGAAPAAAAAGARAAPPREAMPFAFKAENQWRAVPGTQWDPERGAITVQSVEALEQLQKYLGMGFKYEQVTKPELFALRRHVGQLQQQTTAEVEQAKVYLAEWKRMMEMPEEELAAFVLSARQEWPRIEARAERAVAERLLEAARAAQAPPEPDVESIVEEARTGAAQLVQEALHGQRWATPEVARELVEYLQDVQQMDQWVLRAARDFPEMGVRAGQYVANWDTARAMLDRLTAGYRRAYGQLAQQQQQQAARVQATSRVAAANAAAVAQASTGRAPARPPAKAAPAPASRRPAAAARQTKDDIIAEAFAQWRQIRAG